MSTEEALLPERLCPCEREWRRFLQCFFPGRVPKVHPVLADQYRRRLLKLLDEDRGASGPKAEQAAEWLRKAERLVTRKPLDLLRLWKALSCTHNILLKDVLGPDCLLCEVKYFCRRLDEIGTRKDTEVQEAVEQLTEGICTLKCQNDKTKLVVALRRLVNRLEEVHVAWIFRDLFDNYVYKVVSTALLLLSFVLIANGDVVLGPLPTFAVSGIRWLEANVLWVVFVAGLTGACFSVAASVWVQKLGQQFRFFHPWRTVARVLTGGMVAVVLYILVQIEVIHWEMAEQLASNIRSKQPCAAAFGFGFLAGLLERLVFRLRR